MNTRISAARRTAAGLLAALSLLLLPGCAPSGARDRAPVQPLTCTQPAALSGITPAGGAAAAVCWASYETNVTTMQVVDTSSDTVKGEMTLDGVWALKEQSFADHRLALCDRENGMWKFYSPSLTELGTMQADDMEGFFSYEGDTYYYISDHVLCARDVSGGAVRRVPLALELRLLDIMAFDAANSRMVVQFFLSPYGSECGTAILDPATGQLSMLRQERYQAAFTGGDGLCLLSDQCRDAAALCDRAIALTDTMDAGEELAAVNTALDALSRTLSLYPDGFTAQFRNGVGEGGLRILLVAAITSDYGVVGVTYESADWQNIALDIRMSDSLDSLICHELWHATENHILSRDYAAIDPDTWDALNPPGFTYCGDATLSNDLRQWTLYSCDPEDVCFVDGYACVDAREDRARIMEYFMVHEDAAQLLIKSPVIRQKLQIMCDAVRNNFDTAGWGQVRWERLL